MVLKNISPGCGVRASLMLFLFVFSFNAIREVFLLYTCTSVVSRTCFMLDRPLIHLQTRFLLGVQGQNERIVHKAM